MFFSNHDTAFSLQAKVELQTLMCYVLT